MTRTEAKRSMTGAVVAALTKAGLHSAVRTTRVRRSGFKVSSAIFKGAVVAVEWQVVGGEDCDYAAQADRMQVILTVAGFTVTRPFPDPTILGVAK
jgi:hypothetical protein